MPGPTPEVILNCLNIFKEISLAVQWLRLCTSTAGGTGSIPGRGTKIPHAAQCSQKEKKKIKVFKDTVLIHTTSALLTYPPTCKTPTFPLKLIKTQPLHAFPDHVFLSLFGTVSLPSFVFLNYCALLLLIILHCTVAIFMCQIFSPN